MDGSQIMEAMVREGGCGSTWEDKKEQTEDTNIV